MSHKYDNTVILSQGGEHGTHIIEWWEKQNVNTGLYLCSESGFYYGLIDGYFGIYTLGEVQKSNATIMELPEPNHKIIQLKEGVLMEVSEDGITWYKSAVSAITCRGLYVGAFNTWKYARPIQN